jgi:plastocyanin
VAITGDICPGVEVQVGQQVTWTNQDSREHIIRHKPAQGQGQFDSGTLQPGDSFSFTFVQPGSYPYECSPDGAMMGTVTVQE